MAPFVGYCLVVEHLEYSTPEPLFQISTGFSITSTEGQSQESWIANCAKDLSDHLNANPIFGLGAAILLRHILGESADLGPDNMLLTKVSTGGYQLTNIDLTGFRYTRQNEFEVKNREGQVTEIRFGWKKTLEAAENSETLLQRLFSPTVFNSRFVKYSEQYKVDSKRGDAVFNAICKV